MMVTFTNAVKVFGGKRKGIAWDRGSKHDSSYFNYGKNEIYISERINQTLIHVFGDHKKGLVWAEAKKNTQEIDMQVR